MAMAFVFTCIVLGLILFSVYCDSASSTAAAVYTNTSSTVSQTLSGNVQSATSASTGNILNGLSTVTTVLPASNTKSQSATTTYTVWPTESAVPTNLTNGGVAGNSTNNLTTTTTATTTMATNATLSQAITTKPATSTAQPTASNANTTTATNVCPSVTSLDPMKGPKSGGTEVTITGIALVKITMWSICSGGQCGSFFNFSNRADGNLRLKTPAWNNLARTVDIKLNASLCDPITIQFNYTADPIITAFPSPFKTIVEGGISQTMIGSDLDAAKTPKFVIVKQGAYISFSQECEAKNSTLLVCRTPSLEGKVDNSSTIMTIFSVIVVFDGCNVTSSSPLNVFQHPELEALTPLQPFIANKNNAITILGKDLTKGGFSEGDVSVTVGVLKDNNECSDVRVVDTSITCRPPPLDVEWIRYPSTGGAVNHAQPNVTVIIGNYKFPANQIQYVLDEPFNVIMSVMIAILAFIIIVSLVFGILTLCKCGQHGGRTLSGLDAVPYEQMQDVMEESHGMKDKQRSYRKDDSIEFKSMRHMSDSAGVSNEGRIGDNNEYESMPL